MRIGRWSRGPVIGRGSSAAVSIATDIASGDVFAVKSAELSRSASLQREQRILSSLDSPYVVSCFGSEVISDSPSGGCSYNLFLEYAVRGSLADDVAKHGGRLDEAAIRSETGDILRGLAYLHSSGVVHCDVKGHNVLVGSDGTAKLADLGCARRIGEERCEIRGTPMFMAPEVARGEEQGPPADMWALGCTVIEMATGRGPWSDVSDLAAALHRIAFSPEVPEPPSWLSREGKDFLSKCLVRDPRKRWTAEQLLEHEFVSSSPKSSAEQRWESPKSVLDQTLWESLLETDECQSPDDPSKRMEQLIGVGIPRWRWDDDWATIRSNNGAVAAQSNSLKNSH
ncbi:mitogen-activated protein kinase kinase kinase 17-like [Zingiber officinale]|uniref:mitogen-activated protein kinase kinase kinase 17-like n=1 Tax=Zingiber officinale TaxID=94328 RepID=UPI001C4B3610|nr:mitogen-activated protein kinase kinase kinase 17-like [Zingiber officinale]